MGCQVEYTPRAVSDLRCLDQATARRIVRKINEYCRSNRPLDFAKPLKGDLAGAYRFRIGSYRVIFDVGSRGGVTILYVLRLGHRNGIYD